MCYRYEDEVRKERQQEQQEPIREEIRQEEEQQPVQAQELLQAQEAQPVQEAHEEAEPLQDFRIPEMEEAPRSVRERLECRLELSQVIDERKDSPYMQEVKRAMADLAAVAEGKILGDGRTIDLTRERDALHQKLNEIEAKYMAALEKCQIYLEKREPSFLLPKTRYNKVKNTKELLEQELDYLTKLRMDMAEHPEAYEGNPDMSYLDLIYNLRVRTELDPSAEGLELKDFARMITKNAEEALLCRNGKLYRKGEDQPGGDPNSQSRENYDMADRLVKLLLERQNLSGSEEKERIRKNILRGLGVDVKNQVSGPVSMSKIRTLLIRFNRYTADVDRVLQEQKESAKLPKEEQSREYRTARQIDSLLENAFQDTLTRKKKKVHSPRKARNFQEFLHRMFGKKDASDEAREQLERKLRRQVTALLEKCERQGGWTVVKPDKKAMEALIYGRLQAARERTFETIRRIYEARVRLGEEPVQELGAGEVQQLLGLSIAEAIADTNETKLAMTLQLQEYEESRILKADAVLEKKLHAMTVEELGSVHLSEVRDYVLGHGDRWKQMPQEDREAALASVLRIIGNMQEIRLLIHKGLREGLTGEEAETFEKRARENAALYGAQEKNIEKLRKGFPENSAIAKGLKQLRAGKLGGFGAAAAGEAGERLRKPEEERLPQEEQKNKAVEVLSETEGVRFALQDFDEKSVSVITAIFLDGSPSALIKRDGDGKSVDLMRLHDVFRSFAESRKEERQRTEAMTIGSASLTLKQDASGTLTLKMGGKEVTLPRNAAYWAEALESDICSHFDRYEPAHARELLAQIAIRDQNRYTAHGGSRVVYERFLTYHIGIPAEKLANLDAYVLRHLTRSYCEHADEMTKEQIRQAADAYAAREIGKVHINSRAAVESLIALENQRQQREAAEERREAHGEPEVKPLAVQADKAAWTPEEKAYINVVSDLFFSLKVRDPQDLENPLTAESLKKAIRSNKKDFLTVLNMNLFSRVMMRTRLSKLPEFGKAAEVADDILYGFLKSGQTGRYVSHGGFWFSGTATEEKLDAFLLQEDVNRILEEGAGRMKTVVDEISGFVQAKLKTVANDMGSDADDSWKILSDYSISELVEKGITGEEGEGAFNRLVLSGYVEKAAYSDKLKMVSSAIRNCPKLTAEDLQNTDVQSLAGKVLAGYIKGAGPLMHKMMQGIPVSSMGPVGQSMIADVRSRLMEIDEELVDGQLQQIIRESNGTIERIEKEKVLGAASVGQTVLVKIYEKGKTEGVEKVVKILRPDVQNYMERERVFMEECAKKVDADVYAKKHGGASPDANFKGGMLKTYEGKEKAILKELDLRLEADNVEKGKIYEDEFLHIRSMRVDQNTKSTVQTLVLEKADGVSVDKFIEQKNAEREKTEKLATGEADRSRIHVHKTVEELDALRSELKAKQQYLVNLTSKWLDEAIFNTGFFHGDLHAGNVMIDEDGVTVIDYGNANQLTPGEQTDILNLLAAAAKYNDKRVISHIRSMLPPEARRVFDAKGDTLKTNIRTIVKKEDGAPVQTVLAVLNELQKDEVEIPAGLYNFIQCFVRIIGTLTDYKTLIENVDQSIVEVMKTEPDGRVEVNPENQILALILKKLIARTGKKPEGQEEKLEDIVKNAMNSKDVDMALLKRFCSTKHDPGMGGGTAILRKRDLMPNVADLIDRVIPSYQNIFFSKACCKAIHQLTYGTEFTLQDAIQTMQWYDVHIKLGAAGAIMNDLEHDQLNPALEQEAALTERRRGLTDPQEQAACDRELEECRARIAGYRQKKQSIEDKLAQLETLQRPIQQDMQREIVNREAFLELHQVAIAIMKEVFQLVSRDDEEREFIDSMADLSLTTTPQNGQELSEQEKADQEAAERRLTRIANILHRRSDPKSYAERLTDAVVDEESYQTLGASLQEWFEQGDEGEALRMAYRNVDAARKRGALEAAAPEVKAFVEAFRNTLTKRAARIEEIANKKNVKDETGDEEKAIRDLLSANLVMSIFTLDKIGLPYIMGHEMDADEKTRLAEGKKDRKTAHMAGFFESLQSHSLRPVTRNLKEAGKNYSRIMGLRASGDLYRKVTDAEVQGAKTLMNDAINEMLTQIARIEFRPAEQKRINRFFAAIEKHPLVPSIMNLCEEVADYIEEAMKDTRYVDKNLQQEGGDPGALVSSLDRVYHPQLKERDIFPESTLLYELELDKKLGEDGKPISLMERLRAGEKIRWIK